MQAMIDAMVDAQQSVDQYNPMPQDHAPDNITGNITSYERGTEIVDDVYYVYATIEGNKYTLISYPVEGCDYRIDVQFSRAFRILPVFDSTEGCDDVSVNWLVQNRYPTGLLTKIGFQTYSYDDNYELLGDSEHTQLLLDRLAVEERNLVSATIFPNQNAGFVIMLFHDIDFAYPSHHRLITLQPVIYDGDNPVTDKPRAQVIEDSNLFSSDITLDTFNIDQRFYHMGDQVVVTATSDDATSNEGILGHQLAVFFGQIPIHVYPELTERGIENGYFDAIITLDEERFDSGKCYRVASSFITERTRDGDDQTWDSEQRRTFCIYYDNSSTADLESRLTVLETMINTIQITLNTINMSIDTIIDRLAVLETGTPTPEPIIGVEGKVYDDSNNNGSLDVGESGVPNRTILVISLADTSDVNRLTTDSNGDYSIELDAGSGWLVQVEGTNVYSYVTVQSGSPTIINLGL